MLKIKPLLNSQSDWGGTAACTVCCCALSRYILYFREQINFDSIIVMRNVDIILCEAVTEWHKIGAGFLYPSETLAKLPKLAQQLRVVSEVAANVGEPMLDEQGHVIVDSVDSVLRDWDGRYSHTTTCAIVRGGYTFLLFKLQANYYIIDTHANSIGRHAAKLSGYAVVESDSTGLLLRTLLIADILRFVQEYNPLDTQDRSDQLYSSNQVDLTFIGLS